MSDPKAARRLYDHTRREGRIVWIVWTLALIWSVGYCYLFGYQHGPKDWVVQIGLAPLRAAGDLTHFWGFPDWVFFGILLPWLLCTIFTFFFALYGISDDELGAEAEEEAAHGH